MERQRLWIALLSLSLLGPTLVSRAEQRGASSPLEQQASEQRREQLVVSGRVIGVHAPRVFSMHETDGGRELLVFTPRRLSSAVVGARVVVIGVLRRLNATELKRTAGWSAVDERTRARFAGRPVVIASSVLATVQGEAPPAPPAEELPPVEPPEARFALDQKMPLTVRATTLVAYIDGFAGQQVRIVSARVVGVLEPSAFLIEPATRYLELMGSRDRVLVLIHNGALRVPAELLVGSTVRVVGVARTLLGMRVTAEVPWPAQLSPDVVDRLEVRAGVLATSVQTAEGVELTDRDPAGPAR